MRKVITVITIMLLFLFFLVYSGVFKDNTDPLKVTKYFLDYLRNREWFLTYQLHKPGCFNAVSMHGIYKYCKMALIKNIDLTLLSAKSDDAKVKAKIMHKDGSIVYWVLNLEKIDKIWLIKNVDFR